MKRLLSLAVLASLTLSAFGQGQVYFNNRINDATKPLDARIYLNTVASGVRLDGSQGNYRAALIGGAVGATAASLTSAGTLKMLASPTSGATWVSFRTGSFVGVVAVGADGNRVNPDVAYGAQGVFQLVAWEGNYTTWADAYAAGMAGQTRIGWSNPLTLTTSTSLTDQAVPGLYGLNSFAIAYIPEPSSMALAGLGAAALLIFRRRK